MTNAEERAIRRKRRAIKRQERERRRAEYRERQRRREAARRPGTVSFKTGPECLSYATFRNYHPMMWCEVGQHIVRENFMADATACLAHKRRP